MGFSFQGKIDFSSYVQGHKRKQEAKTTITYIFKYLTLKKQRQKNSLLFELDWQMPLAKKCIRIDSSFYTNHKKTSLFQVKSRVVHTKYGRVQGFGARVGRDAQQQKYVEIFLGIPYASPPIGNNR